MAGKKIGWCLFDSVLTTVFDAVRVLPVVRYREFTAVLPVVRYRVVTVVLPEVEI